MVVRIIHADPKTSMTIYVTLHGKIDFADLIKDNCDAGEMIS